MRSDFTIDGSVLDNVISGSVRMRLFFELLNLASSTACRAGTYRIIEHICQHGNAASIRFFMTSSLFQCLQNCRADFFAEADKDISAFWCPTYASCTDEDMMIPRFGPARCDSRIRSLANLRTTSHSLRWRIPIPTRDPIRERRCQVAVIADL